MQPRKIATSRVLLFDRLIDEAPGEAREAHPYRLYDRRQLIDSVVLELSRLLNTRRATKSLGPGEELTVVDYGLRDFASLSSMSPTDREQLALEIARTIEAFEPRLKSVRVYWMEPKADNPRILSAWIEGVLCLGSLTESVSFPLAMEFSGGNAEVLPPIDLEEKG